MRFECKCGLGLCARHRLPEDHECTFDHKAEGRHDLAAANPRVVAAKVTTV